MKFFILILLLIFSLPAHAQLNFDRGVSSPKIMSPDSGNGQKNIQAEMPMIEPEDPDFTSDEVIDDNAMAPAVREIDPFAPVPVETPRPEPRENVKQILKKVPAVQVERSIADDRIDDGYVQGLIKNRFDYNNPID